MHATLPAKNAHAPVHARTCTSAETSLAWKILRTYLEHHAGCHLPPALLLSPPNQSSDADRSRNPSKSTLAHDAVAAAVLHKHHLISRVGTGLVQFVYGSHSRLTADLILRKILFPLLCRGLFRAECKALQVA